MSSALSAADPARVAFACRTCGHRVSVGVWPVRSAQDPIGGEDLIPSGYFGRSVGEHETPADWFMLSPSDVLGAPIRRFDGCCGPSGFERPNVGCAQGHAVGIEQSECYLPHVTVLDPARVFSLASDASVAEPTIIGRAPCRSFEAFCAELHTAFGLTDWCDANLPLILGKWGCRSPERIDLVWMHSDVSRRAGLPIADIQAAFAEQSAYVRLVLA